MIREIVWYGDEVLKQKSHTVEKIDADIKELINDMFETMYQNNGVGLAAVQVNVLKKVIIVGIPQEDESMFEMALINPEIIYHSDEECEGEEGCLSIPDIVDDVFRSTSIKVKYLDIDNNEQILEANDFLARVIQHEIDHTNGILFLDRLESHQKRMHKKDLKFIKSESLKRQNTKSVNEKY